MFFLIYGVSFHPFLFDFKQKSCTDDFKAEEMGDCIAPIYKKVMGVQSIKQMFQAKKHERFLQHLIGIHSLLSPESGRNHDQSENYVMMKYFNQSCAPNTITVVVNGRLLFITARPIKKGEELFDATKSRRRDCCGTDKHGTCECKLCKGTGKRATPAQRRQMAYDPNFKHIMEVGEPSRWKKYDEEKLQTTINKCVAFLKEFGRAEWCDEIEKVMNVYPDFVKMGFEKRVP